MSRAFCWPIPGKVRRKTWSPSSIARAMRPIGAENARAAAFGPMPATEISASKNSRSTALVKPKNDVAARSCRRSAVARTLRARAREPGAASIFRRDARRQERCHRSARRLRGAPTSPSRSSSVPAMRENTRLAPPRAARADRRRTSRSAHREHERRASASETSSGSGATVRPELHADHRLDLLFARGAVAGQRALDGDVRELFERRRRSTARRRARSRRARDPSRRRSAGVWVPTTVLRPPCSRVASRARPRASLHAVAPSRASSGSVVFGRSTPPSINRNVPPVASTTP